jgi:tetratricopeptide (TPR) repeat protein
VVPPRDLQHGDLIGERFEVIALAATGGMARVYRARDTRSGGDAAVKVLLESMHDEVERFEREADVLARLDHPGIVRYLARGRDPLGRPFLAMPWVEGETLAARLRRRGPLPFDEVTRIGAEMADALAAAHAAGIVHRDVKPSNVMLVADGRVMLVDFGVARIVELASELTQTNMFVGTPAYIAPEQARGDPDVGPAADLYSLGGVLYACITGEGPFRGENLVAMLAKVLLQPATRPRESRPDVPRDLEALVLSLLEKDPKDRPQNADDVARTLRGAESAPASIVPTARGISLAEARLCSMVFVGSGAAPGPASPPPAASTLAQRFGATFERLANGTLALRWVEGRGAVERALAAARCAIELRAAVPNAPIALATVRAGIDADEAVSGAIDRAARLLGGAALEPGVRLDATTAHLLGGRFDVRVDGEDRVLLGERDGDDDTRPVRGVATQCVGREAELAILDALLAGVEDDGAARVVAVVGEPGVGKTRLRQEWLRRQRVRERAPKVWFGRGDPLGAVSGYGLLAQALRRAMGVRDDEPTEVRQARVLWTVSEALAADDARSDDVVTFLSELIGAGLSDDTRPALAAARSDPGLMGEHLRSALLELLRGTSDKRPLVIVLEDPQPGDVGSLRLLDAVLGLGDELPVLLAVFARPSLESSMPGLWAERRMQRIVLEPLSTKASERLVRMTLGPGADGADVTRIVTLAGGNAFFLEELARTRSAGGAVRLPDSMLAVIESRFDDLAAQDRRVLRAASVFGQPVCVSAVERVVGGDAAVIRSALARLEDRDIVAEQGDGRYLGQSEFAFRHALVRDAAYATLIDEDRRRAHHAAADWLEERGESDPGLVAWHLELGGEGERAATRYCDAVTQMIGAGAFSQAIGVAERALALTNMSETHAWLSFAISEAAFWGGDNERCARAAEDGMAAAGEATEVFGLCLARRVQMSTRMGDDRTDELLARAVEHVSEKVDTEGIARVAATIGTAAVLSGRRAIAQRMIALVSEPQFIERASVGDRALLYQLLAFAEIDDLELRCDYFEKSAAACEASGRSRGTLLQRINAATVRGLMGQFDHAERALRALEKDADKSGVRFLATVAREELGQVLARRGQWAEARDLCGTAADEFHAQNNQGAEAVARASLSQALLGLGEIDAALEQARRSVKAAAARADARAIGNAAMAEALLAKDLAREALDAATAAMAAWGEGVSSGWESTVRLAHIRALRAVGRDEWRGAQRDARASIERRAARMRDESARRAFLAQRENMVILTD